MMMTMIAMAASGAVIAGCLAAGVRMAARPAGRYCDRDENLIRGNGHE
jgi:hypothetical protein